MKAAVSNNDSFFEKLESILNVDVTFDDKNNFCSLSTNSDLDSQNDTNAAFSEKWRDYKDSSEKQSLIDMQKEWYLKCYGFATESDFATFLQGHDVIYDAGCGIGFKSAWFAELAPESLVVGVDFSDAAGFAADFYKHIPNLFFIQADIAVDIFKKETASYVSCDQVIMHTSNPLKTFATLSRTLKKEGQFSCYFYAKKALPRELVDDYFREHCTNMSHEEIKEMSAQLSELGKRLSELNVSFDAPDIPALGIKGGKIDVQRFIYWNFLKCYWNPEIGRETSDMINFDWYSPVNAARYSKEEVLSMAEEHQLQILNFYQEEACYCGRFVK